VVLVVTSAASIVRQHAAVTVCKNHGGVGRGAIGQDFCYIHHPAAYRASVNQRWCGGDCIQNTSISPFPPSPPAILSFLPHCFCSALPCSLQPSPPFGCSQGFTAVTAAAFLITTYLLLTWLQQRHKTAAAAAAAAEGAASTSPKQQQKKTADALIIVLWCCLLLLCWSAAARLAAFYHPVITSSLVLYYCVSVLPELLVACVFAAPTLAACVALGGRYSQWRQQQEQKQQSSSSSGGGCGSADAEVGVGEAVGAKG